MVFDTIWWQFLCQIHTPLGGRETLITYIISQLATTYYDKYIAKTSANFTVNIFCCKITLDFLLISLSVYMINHYSWYPGSIQLYILIYYVFCIFIYSILVTQKQVQREMFLALKLQSLSCIFFDHDKYEIKPFILFCSKIKGLYLVMEPIQGPSKYVIILIVLT